MTNNLLSASIPDIVVKVWHNSGRSEALYYTHFAAKELGEKKGLYHTHSKLAKASGFMLVRHQNLCCMPKREMNKGSKQEALLSGCSQHKGEDKQISRFRKL